MRRRGLFRQWKATCLDTTSRLMLRSLSYVLSRRRARIASEGCGPSPGSTESSRHSLQTFPEGHTRITIFLTLLAIGVPGCAASRSMPTAEPPVLDSAGDRQSVIAVAERLFSAMKSRDTTAIRQLLAPELVLISVRTAGMTPTHTANDGVRIRHVLRAKPGGLA